MLDSSESRGRWPTRGTLVQLGLSALLAASFWTFLPFVLAYYMPGMLALALATWLILVHGPLIVMFGWPTSMGWPGLVLFSLQCFTAFFIMLLPLRFAIDRPEERWSWLALQLLAGLFYLLTTIAITEAGLWPG